MHKRIENRPPVKEKIIALSVAMICLPLSSLMLVENVTGDSSFASLIGWSVFGLTVLVGTFFIWFSSRERGSLWVNDQDQTFSLDGKNYYPYKELAYYQAKNISTPLRLMRFFYQSRMLVRIGISKKQSFLIPDNNGSLFNIQGAPSDEVHLMEELVKGSSLSDLDKASFQNWVARTRIANGDLDWDFRGNEGEDNSSN